MPAPRCGDPLQWLLGDGRQSSGDSDPDIRLLHRPDMLVPYRCPKGQLGGNQVTAPQSYQQLLACLQSRDKWNRQQHPCHVPSGVGCTPEPGIPSRIQWAELRGSWGWAYPLMPTVSSDMAGSGGFSTGTGAGSSAFSGLGGDWGGGGDGGFGGGGDWGFLG